MTSRNEPVSQQEEAQVTVSDLPMSFKVKYLGIQNARGLWGIKHTRRPVDYLVTAAKNLPANKILPIYNLTVSIDGVATESVNPGKTSGKRVHKIDTISYGVQDLVYTRVFAMIIVKENCNLKEDNPFEVHAYVCDSRAMARKLTFALAAAFQDYSKKVKDLEESSKIDGKIVSPIRKKFAIDLRSPEEMQQELDEQETEA